MLRIAIALLASAVVMAEHQDQPLLLDAPDAGVPLALAQDRAARVSNLRYELHFAIPANDQGASGLDGTVTLRFDLASAARPLYLDFAAPSAASSRAR